ncbi:MAG: DUF3098 domain-containing protein [Chitinophagaceae bacterium]
MADKKPIPATAVKTEPARLKADNSPIFSKGNYLLMGVGGALIIIGMVVMAGGSSSDPNVFDYNQVYSKTRITFAPILIILGILVEVYAIFKKSPAAE